MIFTFLFIYILFKRFTISVSEDISVIDDCFKNTENNSTLFDISGIKYNEFSVLALQANEMIKRHQKAEKEITRKNIELKKSLKEKKIFIREVHHRVKNNMAIISSLLSLQSNEIKNKQLKQLIQSSQTRIQSMAMIHEHIYKNENIHDINVKVYIKELVEYLLLIFDISYDEISLDVDISDIILELDTLIPLGMLINEIVSNSFKYAFKTKETFELSIILRSTDEKIFYLNITDNGPGFNSENNSGKQGSIGLQLIKGLIEQIDGRFKITTKGKTAYEIYFQT